MEIEQVGAELTLRYAVEWRPYLWLPAVEYLLRDPKRFEGKRVLDLGCRYGKMSCWFAAQGAIVDGCDVTPRSIAIAQAEQSRWGIDSNRLSFHLTDGDLSKLPRGEYDFIFTKSVLSALGDHTGPLLGISAALKPGGQYLAVENAAASFPVSLLRRWRFRRWDSSGEKFRGIDQAVLSEFHQNFKTVNFRKFRILVAAVEASNPISRNSSEGVANGAIG